MSDTSAPSVMSKAKKFTDLEMVNEAFDILYPRPSPSLKSSSMVHRRSHASTSSPLRETYTVPVEIKSTVFGTPSSVLGSQQTWVDQNAHCPFSSSPAETQLEIDAANLDVDDTEDNAYEESLSTGNSPILEKALHISDRPRSRLPPTEQCIHKNVCSDDSCDDEDYAEQVTEQLEISGPTELTEDSLEPGATAQMFGHEGDYIMAGALSDKDTLQQRRDLVGFQHPGNPFLEKASLDTQVRGLAYEQCIGDLEQKTQSPMGSELASADFEYRRNLTEEGQIQRLQERAFQVVLEDIESTRSREHQYHAWNQVRTYFRQQNVHTEHLCQLNGSNSYDRQATGQHHITDVRNMRRESLEEDLVIDVDISSLSSEAEDSILEILSLDAKVTLQRSDRQNQNDIADEMDTDDPQSTVMDISPLEQPESAVEPQSAAMEISPIEYFQDAVIQCARPFPEQGASLLQHTLLSIEHSHPQNGFGGGKQPHSPLRQQFNIHDDDDMLNSNRTAHDAQSINLSLEPPQVMRTDMAYASRIEPSTIHKSIEYEILQSRQVRESTPAYEDRSLTPSPASHAASSGRSSLSIEFDLVRATPVEFDIRSREVSMPPPSPARSTHNTQREYNLPSSSPPDAITIAAHCDVNPSPAPDSVRPPYQILASKLGQKIPLPPPIPDDASPIHLSKRCDRNKSGVQGKIFKIEKTRSVTGNLIKTTQTQRSRSRKVTQARGFERAINNMLDDTGERGNKAELDLSSHVASDVGKRRSARLKSRM